MAWNAGNAGILCGAFIPTNHYLQEQFAVYTSWNSPSAPTHEDY